MTNNDNLTRNANLIEEGIHIVTNRLERIMFQF